VLTKILHSLHQAENKEEIKGLSETTLFCSVVCNGKSKLTDKAINLKQETQWLKDITNEHKDNFKAIIYYEHDSGDKVTSGNSHDNDPAQLQCQNNKHAHLVKDISKVLSAIEKSKVKNDKILLACTVKNPKNELSEMIPPYTYYDRLRDRFYSMVIEGKLENINLMLRLPGFIDWLNVNRPEMLYNDCFQSSEYLMLWLVKCIQNSNGDILDGLRSGLTAIFNHKIGGQFNLLFSDGSGVFAFSNEYDSKKEKGNISYKIIRDEQTIFSYILRNNHPSLNDSEWIHIRYKSLYYFPVQGALQNYINIDIATQPEAKLNKCMNWVCLALLSC
jgi:hypothetical protein